MAARRISYERWGISPDTAKLLETKGHALQPIGSQGVAEVIVVNEKENLLEGAFDRRAPDGGAVGVTKR